MGNNVNYADLFQKELVQKYSRELLTAELTTPNVSFMGAKTVRITADNGSMTGARLTLLNPITTAGTPQNADNMNNLFDIDNMDSMKDNARTIVFNDDGSIIEEIKADGSGIVNARRETFFPTPKAVVEKTTVYSDDGAVVLRETTITTSFGTNITEVVN